MTKAKRQCFHCEVISAMRRGIEPAPRDIRTAKLQGCTCGYPDNTPGQPPLEGGDQPRLV